MKRKITCTDEPLGDMEIVPDFLPPPSELVFREEGVKVTPALSNGVPLLPARTTMSPVTLELVNQLRDESP